MDPEVVAAFILAAQRGDASAIRTELGRLVPAIGARVRAVLARQRALARRARVGDDDALQHVLERCLSRPPLNHENRDPVVVLMSWVATVTVNHLLDRAARRREQQLDAGGQEGEAVAEPAERARLDRPETYRPADQDDALATRRALAHLQECAERELARSRHRPKVFAALLEDPDLSGLDLALRIELVASTDPQDPEARRAAAHAWKLRQLTLEQLRACLEAFERGERVARKVST